MLSGSAAAEPLWMIFIDQDGGIDIGKWNVVLRILRPFPDVASRYRIEDCLASEVAPDAPRHRLDVVERRDHLRVIAHGRLIGHASSRRWLGYLVLPQQAWRYNL
jgi:hypothetical protein